MRVVHVAVVNYSFCLLPFAFSLVTVSAWSDDIAKRYNAVP